MNIIHVPTEFAPVIKVEGLADVVYSLCSYLSQKKEIKISVLLPLYNRVLQLIKSLKIFANRRVFRYRLPLAVIVLLFGKRVSEKLFFIFWKSLPTFRKFIATSKSNNFYFSLWQLFNSSIFKNFFIKKFWSKGATTYEMLYKKFK